jgi:hypothetical protein
VPLQPLAELVFLFSTSYIFYVLIIQSAKIQKKGKTNQTENVRGGENVKLTIINICNNGSDRLLQGKLAGDLLEAG